ncbi:hypothetical protein [Imperialibacter roseus]|uniref:WD40-like Beta Propeller Repeat n=1 Tax=Imperialibacter roseus TaxID=1324217 RepID=A0ABZ0IQT7_9BACT|nr:hypothetical protein [Imperialibacter roseus]WOK07380.1 hypothetical protein RT717_01935 [Imperialibacter roseus]|tara:strand:+ start:25628 stop:26851 length:1224 start_codon:yes stop_codon:yes gene_type:complete
MRKLATLLSIFGFIALSSCQQEDLLDVPLRPSYLVGYPKESGIDLGFISRSGLLPGALSSLPVKGNKPDSYDIFVSTDAKAEFTRVSTLFTDGNRLSIENLTNGTPYYVTVAGNKKGLASVQYDTIMVVPSKPKQLTKGSWVYDHAENISFSPTTDSAAYITRYIYSNWRDTPDLYIFPYYTNEPRRIEHNVKECEWAPSGRLIAFSRRLDANDPSGKDLQLSVYDLGKDTTINLPVFSTTLGSMTFSPNGEWIYYIDGDENENDLVWRIKIDGSFKEPVIGRQSFALEKSSNFVIDKITLSPHSEEVYFSGSENNYQVIYRHSLKSKTSQILFDDPWSSYLPSISPDGQKLAFFSTRSGATEVWTYDLSQSSLKQRTGSPLGGWYGLEIEWVTNSELSIGNRRLQL